MFCNRCGKQVTDDAKFCARCGAPLAPRAQGPNGPNPAPPHIQAPNPGTPYAQAPNPGTPYTQTPYVSAPTPSPTEKKRPRKRGAKIALLLSAILAAAALFVIFALPKIIPGFSMPWQKEREEEVVIAEESSVIEELPVEEVAIDVDAVAEAEVALEGTYMSVAGTEGFLQFPKAMNLRVAGPDADETILRDVYSVLVVSNEAFPEETLNGLTARGIKITGALSLNEKGEPVITPSQIFDADGKEISPQNPE